MPIEKSIYSRCFWLRFFCTAHPFHWYWWWCFAYFLLIIMWNYQREVRVCVCLCTVNKRTANFITKKKYCNAVRYSLYRYNIIQNSTIINKFSSIFSITLKLFHANNCHIIWSPHWFCVLNILTFLCWLVALYKNINNNAYPLLLLRRGEKVQKFLTKKMSRMLPRKLFVDFVWLKWIL